ncbi:group II truncated hemoglobin [Nonomuraea sp. NPDC049784]|uniref:group II truncated hemoglobin n=1 Tax=Nonomuraea sp. NPDC049784 TaxID=3154361 RepID=UPI0033DD95C5
MTSLYAHAGGDEGLHRLEEVFYAKVLADPLLKALFPEPKPHHVQNLTWFTAESFGGPDRFTRELGFEHIINVHRHLRITEEQRQRFVDLYMQAVEESDMPVDPAFRQAVHDHVEFGSHVAMQNSHAATDADLHPLREVPRWNWAGDKQQDPAP